MKRPGYILTTALALLLINGLPAHADPQLLEDINSTGDSTVGFNFLGAKTATTNGYYFFAGSEGIHGFEPWVINTTTGEEKILADIVPGPQSSGPDSFVASGNQVFFTASDTVAGKELWVSDGTPAGTHRVQDSYPGTVGSNPQFLIPSGTSSVVYTALDPTGGVELWMSDGSDAGTFRVADINSGEPSSAPLNLASLEGWVYFSTNDGVHGRELWRSNGTTTTLVLDIESGEPSSSPTNILSNGGQIFFSACTADEGCELWRSKGTSDTTTPYQEINPGPENSSPYGFVWNPDLSMLFFGADDGTNGFELWTLEPDSESLNRLTDLNPGSASSSPRSFLVLGATVLFTANDGSSGTKLFSSDGIGSNVVKVLSSIGPTASINSITEYDGRAYLTHGSACWYSNGTPSGTIHWTDDCSSSPRPMEAEGRLFLGMNSFENPREIWSTSRDEADLVQETDATSFSSDPDSFTDLNSSVIFAANDGIGGRELWTYDDQSGTAKGVDIFPGATGSSPENLTPFKSEIWFTVRESDFGRELWHTDGTLAGTEVIDFVPGAAGIFPRNLEIVGSSLFFVGSDIDFGDQVFRSDGSVDGTVMISDGVTYGVPQYLTSLGDRLYFFAQNSAGRELWMIDETQTTPTMLEAIPGSSGTWANQLIAWNGFVYFVVDDGVTGDQLWRSNGSTPVAVTSLVSASGSSTIPWTAVGPDGVYFVFDDRGDFGRELWKTDGTTTVRVTDIVPGPEDSYPEDLVSAGERAFFVADDDVSGSELWWTDGTVVQQVDIVPGPDGSYPSDLVSAGNRVLFSAWTPGHGRELWQSNGTLTSRLTDLWPGVGSSDPEEMAASGNGDWAYFSGITEATWREPFRLELSFFAHGFENGDLTGWSQVAP